MKKKTVVVVGAGASSEYSLPTGDQLKSKISSLLNFKFENGRNLKSGDWVIYEALRFAAKESNPNRQNTDEYLRASRRIAAAMPLAMSIDNFLDAHGGDDAIELCGKLAVARAILAAEGGSTLKLGSAHPRAINFEASQSTWLNAFFRLITENCRAEDLPERFSNLTLIIFNYDRCVEHYLYHALQIYYGLNGGQASEAISSIGVFHPYGVVGALPWMGGAQHSIEFGEEPDSNPLLSIAKGLRTFTEGTDPSSSEVLEIRSRFLQADSALFLGFAYHRLNLSLIRPRGAKHPKPDAVQYFGSAWGVSESDCAMIQHDLSELADARPEKIHLRNELKCTELINEYWRSLAGTGGTVETRA